MHPHPQFSPPVPASSPGSLLATRESRPVSAHLGPAAGCEPLKALAAFRPFFLVTLPERDRDCAIPSSAGALTSRLSDFDKVIVPNGPGKAPHQPLSDEISRGVEIASSFKTFGGLFLAPSVSRCTTTGKQSTCLALISPHTLLPAGLRFVLSCTNARMTIISAHPGGAFGVLPGTVQSLGRV